MTESRHNIYTKYLGKHDWTHRLIFSTLSWCMKIPHIWPLNVTLEVGFIGGWINFMFQNVKMPAHASKCHFSPNLQNATQEGDPVGRSKTKTTWKTHAQWDQSISTALFQRTEAGLLQNTSREIAAITKKQMTVYRYTGRLKWHGIVRISNPNGVYTTEWAVGSGNLSISHTRHL